MGTTECVRLTMAQILATDANYADHVIVTVRDHPSLHGQTVSGWQVFFKDGSLLRVPPLQHGHGRPMPGEVCRVYYTGNSWHIRGLVIGGRIYRYSPPTKE